ncbi:NAD(P)H-dependent oxidoreductase [Actinobacillus vicugnae]|uniref:NAD(P)H-dependent oxidoreductase n=1 Tax=Actinobacillus vicugnae TaxID=2573093 RepID=UPI001242BD7B|nr:NAD(P)H-dependent oxidoreductase [Actinobacillus vicugnae]
MKTLVIVSHPYYERSEITKAFVRSILTLGNDVTIRNIDELYGTDFTAINVEEEQKAFEAADRIVFLFPVHWFNLTPMLKAYMNAVWSYGWAFGEGGYAIAGKELQVICSAGAREEVYQPNGLVQCTGEDILSSIEASAYYTGMTYNTPMVFMGVGAGVSDELLADWQNQVLARLGSPLGTNVKSKSTRRMPA